ncbi:hypothetical protein BG011_008590 [Mortierella polycephala]|uniref:WD40 repeat-like protein n=1 Tax=Mortierella polycephala TaxID=41804 RepID=A0A9P6PNQ1_9FUNG|nr:hypothetical protein BG011_008590 [Mortierella polycephala]
MNNNQENQRHGNEDEDDDENDTDYQYEIAAEDDDDEEEDEDEDEDENEDEEEDEDIEIEFEFDGDEDDDEDEDDDDTGNFNLANLFAGGGRPAQIRQRKSFAQHYALIAKSSREAEEFDERTRTPSPIPEPDREKGNELLNSGEFGRVDSAFVPSNMRNKSASRKLWMRQLKPRTIDPLSIGETILPDNPGKVIDAYNDSAYSGQYSVDGSLFASCDKDWQLRIYKTAGNRLIRENVIHGVPGQWTITDHNLSLDNNWIIYSSITPCVYLTRTAADAPDTQHQLDFSTGEDDYGLWSVRFSGDGREIVAGGKERIYVYDIESRSVLNTVMAHKNDVNSVCFAEPTSSQVVFSGSDDHLIKVWDRRSMGVGRNGTPSGILVGHSEGITYVTSKGDNRYLASNGKDQKMLLWDLRMMHSTRDYAKLPKYRDSGFDYRSHRYTGHKSFKVPGDCSVMAFQGHKVLKTLIRCHFSPVHSTGQRYLYTGSADGKVAIYRLDGTRVRTLDTSAAFQRYTKSPRLTPYVTRDVSWHPYHPTIMSSCMADRYFNHDVEGGIVRHTFTRADEELDLNAFGESDTEVPEPPRQRRRFIF